MIGRLICRASEAADAAIASPWGLPVYVVARVVLWRFVSTDVTNVALSDFANTVLLLLAVSGAKRSRMLERQVDALARANPDVDDQAIRSEVKA